MRMVCPPDNKNVLADRVELWDGFREGGEKGNWSVKGTIRPDWICMRVVSLESPLKGQPLYVFKFLFLILNVWKNFKVLSRLMQKWLQPPACSDLGLHRILSCYWLAHFHLMKNPPKCTSILVWIAEWWMQAATQRTIDVSPAYLGHSSAKKIAVWAHANCDPNKQED